MSADLDLVERAVVLAAAVISAVVDSASYMLVCKFASHNKTSFHDVYAANKCRDNIMSREKRIILGDKIQIYRFCLGFPSSSK